MGNKLMRLNAHPRLSSFIDWGTIGSLKVRGSGPLLSGAANKRGALKRMACDESAAVRVNAPGRARPKRLVGMLAFSLCAGGGIAFVASLASLDGQLEAGLTAAISTPDAVFRASTTRTSNTSAQQFAASEADWLGYATDAFGNNETSRHVEAVSLPGEVSAGDRLTLTWGGVVRELDVVGVADLADGATRLDNGSRATRVLVTAREPGANGSTVRFVIDAVRHAGTSSANAEQPSRPKAKTFGPPRSL